MSSHEVPLIVRAAGKGIFRGFLEATSRGMDVEGKEHLPENPPYLIAFNHFGWTEGLVPYVLLSIKNWPFTITKIENMDQTFLGTLMRPLGFIGIRRGEADMRALKRAIQLLKDGNVVATSPEGTRGRGDERVQLKGAKSGLIFLSQQFEPPLPIVPVAVWGQNEVTFPLIDVEGLHRKDWGQLRKMPLYIRIGEPFVPVVENPGTMTRSEIRDTLADELLGRIRQLLPPAYTGV